MPTYAVNCIHMKNHLYTAGTDDLHIFEGVGEENIEPSVLSVKLLYIMPSLYNFFSTVPL